MNQQDDEKEKSSADMTEAEASSEGQKLAEEGGGSRVVVFGDFGAFQVTPQQRCGKTNRLNVHFFGIIKVVFSLPVAAHTAIYQMSHFQ